VTPGLLCKGQGLHPPDLLSQQDLSQSLLSR
jgi:hypothetical protein